MLTNHTLTFKEGALLRDMSHSVYHPEKPPSVPTPGFFQKIRTGETLPVTPWHRHILTVQPSPVNLVFTRYRPSRDELITHSFQGSLVANWQTNLPSYTTTELNALSMEARGKAASAGWDIGTMTAEANRTYDMVRHAHNRTFERVGNILNSRRRTIRTLAEFASVWMEARYGWRILMYDLESASEAVERFKQNVSLERFTVYDSKISDHESWPSAGVNNSARVRAFGSNEKGTSVDSGGGQRSSPYGFGDMNVTLSHKLEVRSGSGFESTRALQGLVLNPALTAWELIPYTFILDWFYDVGSSLAAVTPTIGRKHVYSWRSIKRTVRIDWRPSYAPRPNDALYRYSMSGHIPPGYIEHVYYDRTPVSGSVASLTRLNPRLNLGKFADLAALTQLRYSRSLGRLQP